LGGSFKIGSLERGESTGGAEGGGVGICPLAHHSNVPLPVVGSYRQVFSGETIPILGIGSPPINEGLLFTRIVGEELDGMISCGRNNGISEDLMPRAGLKPRPACEDSFRLKYLIRSVIPFDPDPSLLIVSRGLVIFIMACHPASPAIIMTRDPHSFPIAWDPFTSHFPVARHIFLSWWIIMRFRRWGDNNRRWRRKSSE